MKKSLTRIQTIGWLAIVLGVLMFLSNVCTLIDTRPFEPYELLQTFEGGLPTLLLGLLFLVLDPAKANQSGAPTGIG